MNRDEQIKHAIEEELKGHRLLRNVAINIEVANAIVTLHGMVDALAEKWTAGEIVKRIPGVAGLDNSLTVAMDREVSDSQIFSTVEERFEHDPRLELHTIEVGVNDGVVYLQGTVANLSEASTAIETAAGVYGVKDIVNRLNVGVAHRNNDEASITNAVELALSRSTMVGANNVNVITKGQAVTLKGTVDTTEQVEAAERIVAQVPGVAKIVNQLDSRHGGTSQDAKLTNQLRDHLGGHGLGSVKAFVLDGTAFLDGVVDQPGQRHRAQELASEVRGVEHVNNGIQIDQT